MSCIKHVLWYLEIGEMFSHEAVDLTDWQASRFTVLQSHEDQDAAVMKETCFLAKTNTIRLIWRSHRIATPCSFKYDYVIKVDKNINKLWNVMQLPVWVNGLGEEGLCGALLVWFSGESLERIF